MQSDTEKYLAEVKERDKRAAELAERVFVFKTKVNADTFATLSPNEWASVVDSLTATHRSQADVRTLLEMLELRAERTPDGCDCDTCLQFNRIARAAMEKTNA
jgi:hypothetical protein